MIRKKIVRARKVGGGVSQKKSFMNGLEKITPSMDWAYWKDAPMNLANIGNRTSIKAFSQAHMGGASPYILKELSERFLGKPKERVQESKPEAVAPTGNVFDSMLEHILGKEGADSVRLSLLVSDIHKACRSLNKATKIKIYPEQLLKVMTWCDRCERLDSIIELRESGNGLTYYCEFSSSRKLEEFLRSCIE